MGNPAWIICKMSWSCCSIFFLRHLHYIFCKALLYFSQTLVLFFWDYFSKRFNKALLLFFKTLLFSFKVLLVKFSQCKQALIFYSGCKPALLFILLSMKQCPILFSKTLLSSCFNFWMCKHTISWSYFFIIFWIILNMCQMLVLIM